MTRGRLLLTSLVLVGAFCVASLLAPSPGWAKLFDHLHWSLGDIAAPLMAWRGWAIYAGAGESDLGRTRFRLALGQSLYLIGHCFWEYQSLSGWNPFPSMADIGFLGLGLCASWAFSGLNPRLGEQRVAALLDTLALTITLLAGTVVIAIPPRSSLGAIQLMTLLAYPAGFLTATAFALMLMCRFRALQSLGMGLLTASLGGLSIVWSLWNYQGLTGKLSNGSVLNVCFSICQLSFCAGALYFEPLSPKPPNLGAIMARTADNLAPLNVTLMAAIALLANFDGALNDLQRNLIDLAVVVVMVLEGWAQRSSLVARRSVEDSLRENRSQLSAILDTLREGVIAFSTERRILYFNASARRSHGYTDGSSIPADMTEAAPYFRLFYLDGRPLNDVDGPLTRALRGESVVDQELLYERQDMDLKRIFSYSGELVRDAAGAPLMAILSIADITERRRAEQEVRQLNADLERRVEERTAELRAANRELDAFAYAVSHDLRAPLRAINGFSHAILEDYGASVSAEIRDYLDEIIVAGTRMGELIDGLLSLSRSTRAPLRREEVDITAIVDEIIEGLRSAAPQRNVVCTVARSMVAHGDKRMIWIVFKNLLDNAWKYTEKTENAVISVHQEMTGGELCFVVADNGAGFDMKHVEQLFKPFQRLHRQDEFPGIGIGLATVQRIIHRHGGETTATAVPGKGATFRFTLEPSPPPQLD